MSAISRIVSMIGWSAPRRIGRPGVVTSTASAASRASSSAPRSSVPRSASAASIAPRTSLATAPTRGRSSGGQRADAAQDGRQAALLAEDVELDRLEGRRRRGRPRSRPAPRHAAPPGRGSGRRDPRSSCSRRIDEPSTIVDGRGFGRGLPGDQAPFAASTIFVKVPASRTATSASVLRSSSISAFFRPATNAP